MQRLRRRVVVTGLGIVSPLGNSISDSWNGILQSKSGIAPITGINTESLATKIAAQVRDFDSTLSLSDKEARRTDLFVQYAVEAARQAMIDSGLEITESLSVRAGVAIGSGIGGLPGIETAWITDDSYYGSDINDSALALFDHGF